MGVPLKVGLGRTETVHVDRGRTIEFLGEADRVYSTPSMVNDVEYACWRLIQAHVDASQTSLGARITLEHLGPTPLGEDVTVAVRVEALDGRRVQLHAQVSDRSGVVGRGEHLRVLVDIARHRQRLAARRNTP